MTTKFFGFRYENGEEFEKKLRKAFKKKTVTENLRELADKFCGRDEQ